MSGDLFDHFGRIHLQAQARLDDERRERAARQRAEFEAHRASCRSTLCSQCSRFACRSAPECTTVVSERGAACAMCMRAEDLAELERRVPKRFRDVFREDGRLESLLARPGFGLSPERARQLLEWAAAIESPPSLVFVGALRKGKTSSAFAALGAWCAGQHATQAKRVKRVRFVDALTLGLAREQHKLGQGEAPEIVDAIGASVLILDDVGQEPARHAEAIRLVVRKRSDDARPTWLTTWLTREELAERYADGGFAARVYEAKRVQFGDGP